MDKLQVVFVWWVTNEAPPLVKKALSAKLPDIVLGLPWIRRTAKRVNPGLWRPLSTDTTKPEKTITDSRDLEMYKNQSDTQQQNWRVRHGGGSRIGVRPQRNRLWHKKKSTQFSRRRCNFCKSYTKQNQSTGETKATKNGLRTSNRRRRKLREKKRKSKRI